MNDIAGLLERVRNFDGTDEALEGDIFSALIGIDAPDAAVWFGGGGSILMSVDRVLALVERKLPGTLISLTQMVSGWQASIIEPDPEALGMVMNDHFADGDTAPLAILAALLSALSSGDAS